MGSKPQRWTGELALNLCMSWLSCFLLMGPVSVFFLLLGFNAECVKPQADCVTSARPSCWSCLLKGNCGPPCGGHPGRRNQKGCCCLVGGLGLCGASRESHGLFRARTVTTPVPFSSPGERPGRLSATAKPSRKGFEGEKPPEPSHEPAAGPGSISTLSSKGMQLKRKQKQKQKKRERETEKERKKNTTLQCSSASPSKAAHCQASVIFCEGLAECAVFTFLCSLIMTFRFLELSS